ncbi:ABC transporter permease [Cellulomonas sp. C5510]|uniref:ABC transporter permease n=1 Tax=Cellulomonas sp. C5510 TaxID=2871170 RepID=UPI001C94AA53|nr:ABC transporter permease [Cellulomonas sp. C5510]QZN85589.1 ABC transporter permease [Cellulomonas sp. C5510]
MTPPAATTRPWLRLAWLHTRFQVLETVRVPIALIGNLLFPGLALLFFVVPQRAVADDPLASVGAVAQLGTFAVMSACLFTLGAGVAEDRQLAFDPYVRTLPAGAGPRLAGRIANAVLFCLLAQVPVVLIAVLLTSASTSPGRALGGLAMVPVVAVPFTLLGLAIGYALSSKAAIAVVQAVLFPLAFAGGLFMPPEIFPRWLDLISQGLPSRAARDLVVQVTTGAEGSPAALPVLLAWTAVFGVLAVGAYRRDEGRRFR